MLERGGEMMRNCVELVKALQLCPNTCRGCPRLNTSEPFAECKAKLNRDAADAIEELLDELTTIRKQLPCWISVEERLPEINDDVLVCNMDYGKTELGFATDAVWDGDNFLSAWNRASAIHCVTHWMPLPKAPEPPKGVE